MKTLSLPSDLLKVFGSLIPTKQDPFDTTHLLIDPNTKEMFVSSGVYLCHADLSSLDLPTNISDDDILEINSSQIKIALLKSPKGIADVEFSVKSKTGLPAIQHVHESISDDINYGSPCPSLYADPKYFSLICKAFSIFGPNMTIKFPNDPLHCIRFEHTSSSSIPCQAFLMPRHV